MLCPVMHKKPIKKTTQYPNNIAVEQVTERVAMCGRKQSVFFRVHYSELSHWRKNEGKHDDMFGLCDKHAPSFERLKAWNVVLEKYHSAVSGLRGRVGSVERIAAGSVDLDALAKEDKNQRKIAAVKSNIKRTMNQVNTKNLTVEHWRQCFEETLNEWITETVMKS
jgi:hypothetical protein